MWEKISVRFQRTSRRTRQLAVTTVIGLAITIWAIITDHFTALVVTLLVATPIVLMIMRARKVHSIKEAKIEAAIGRTKRPGRFGPWMLPHETVEWEDRKHPVAILRWWLLAAAAPVVGIALGLITGSFIVFLIVTLIPLLIAGWPILEWWLDWRVITNVRVVEIKGVINIKAPAAPLGKILTAAPEKPLLSRLLEAMGLPHYAHIVFETAAQVESIPSLPFVTNPEEVNSLLQSHFAPAGE
jgi:ribose/xylose/arabinose/galactoside ABC-type transport system permease subunit